MFRKADPNAIDLISRLLEYTPTQRLSAVEAMVHPFFDELRDPTTKLPDSRHPNAPAKDLPVLFDFTHHGKPIRSSGIEPANKCLQNSPSRLNSTTNSYLRTSSLFWQQRVWTSTISNP